MHNMNQARALPKASHALAFVLTVAVGSTMGCGRAAEAVLNAADAAEDVLASVDAATQISGVASSMLAKVESCSEETDEETCMEQVAAAITTGLEEEFGDCVSTTTDTGLTTSIDITFACEGEQTDVSITGNISGTLTSVLENTSVKGVELDLASTDLSTAGQDLQIDVLVNYLFDEATAEESISGAIVDAERGSLAVSAVGTVAVGAACAAYDGSVGGEGNDRDFSAEISGYERCLDSCPTEGSTIVVSANESGDSSEITITTDGSSNASVTTNKGESFTIPTRCAD